MRRSSGGRQIIALLNVVEQTKLAGEMSWVWFRASGSFPCQRDGEFESTLQRQVCWPSLMRMFESPVKKHPTIRSKMRVGGLCSLAGRERGRDSEAFIFQTAFDSELPHLRDTSGYNQIPLSQEHFWKWGLEVTPFWLLHTSWSVQHSNWNTQPLVNADKGNALKRVWKTWIKKIKVSLLPQLVCPDCSVQVGFSSSLKSVLPTAGLCNAIS